jgi:hypothetical protein
LARDVLLRRRIVEDRLICIKVPLRRQATLPASWDCQRMRLCYDTQAKNLRG